MDRTTEIVNNDLQESEENADMCEKSEVSEETADKSAADYAELVRSDIRELAEEFPELSGLSDICELENPLRYAALRDLGLSPAEAYLASSKKRAHFDNRSHLHSTPIIPSRANGYMPEHEMAAARELFSDMSDAEIRRLYKKVTK